MMNVTNLQVSDHQIRVLHLEGNILPQHRFSQASACQAPHRHKSPSSQVLTLHIQKSLENLVSKQPILPSSVSWCHPTPRMCTVGSEILLPLLLCDSGQVIKLCLLHVVTRGNISRVCRSEKRSLRISVCGELNTTVIGKKENDLKSQCMDRATH